MDRVLKELLKDLYVQVDDPNAQKSYHKPKTITNIVTGQTYEVYHGRVRQGQFKKRH